MVGAAGPPGPGRPVTTTDGRPTAAVRANGVPGRAIRLGLRENLGQFVLLVAVNALVGGMVGQERTVLPLLAEQAFRDFLRKYPDERLVPDAQYWLGETLFQRQRYRDAAESFLAVSTKFEKSGKAPDSLLRLGQSLAAMNQKEAACATLAEVERKFPRASASVKRGVAQEQKRVHC